MGRITNSSEQQCLSAQSFFSVLLLPCLLLLAHSAPPRVALHVSSLSSMQIRPSMPAPTLEGTLLGATPKWTARAREYQDSSGTVVVMLPALTAHQSVSPLEDSLPELSVCSPSNMQGPPTPVVLLPATILPGATLKWTLRVTACVECMVTVVPALLVVGQQQLQPLPQQLLQLQQQLQLLQPPPQPLQLQLQPQQLPQLPPPLQPGPIHQEFCNSSMIKNAKLK